MMTGRVEALHALLPITFRLPGQPDISIEFVVDTGFTGALTLPLPAVTALKLLYSEETYANLATDQDVALPVYEATIVWNGVERDVRVIATGRRPLLGTSLLKDYELLAQFADGGLVTIDEL
ncbi:MAG TPA: clan AA aspartic protease [Chthonomonadaceae bacterium]|nr:clan AA aspartic protease [Chthonomonadaceae bacterium]